MPEPMIPETTIIVASKRVSLRAKAAEPFLEEDGDPSIEGGVGA